MDPRYFAHTLTTFEASLYISGLNRRYRHSWEQARYTGFLAMKPHYKDGFTIDDLGQFQWEKKSDCNSSADPADELKRLRAMARKRDQELKLNNNGIR